MKSISLLAVLALYVASTQAKCNTTGAKGSSQNINPHVPAICDALAGNYVKNEQRHQCVMDNAGQQWDFTLKYIGSAGSRNIGSAECQNGMFKETVCPQGGKSSYANWFYNADPNAGSCFSS